MDDKRNDHSAELLQLWQKATEELGLDPAEPLCRDIAYLRVCWNEQVYERVQRGIHNLEQSREEQGNLGDRVPPPNAFEGNLRVAAAPAPGGRSTVAGIEPAQLLPATVITGLPGKGKTWLCRLILALLAIYCPWIRVLVLDPNRSYERSCSDPRYWVSLPWQDVRLNPLVPPPGYPEAQWRTETIDVLTRGELLHSRYLLANRLDHIFEAAHRASPPGSPMLWPSLYELRDALISMKCRPGSRDWQYRDAALNVIDGRIRTSGLVYDCSSGMEPILTNTRARISTEGLAPLETLDYFISNLIHYLYRQRCTEPVAEPPDLHTLAVLEEAQTLLQPRSGGINFFQEILLRSRAAGLGFLLITQDISHIDPLILAACSNYFVFAQSSGENKRIARNMLDLSARETEQLGSLSVGECFVRFVGHPHWPHPFLARIPHD